MAFIVALLHSDWSLGDRGPSMQAHVGLVMGVAPTLAGQNLRRLQLKVTDLSWPEPPQCKRKKA